MGHSTVVRISRTLAMGLAAVVLASQMGCIPIRGTEFRDTALPAVQSGVTSIMNGLIDGIFAAIEPEPQSSD